MDLRTIMNSDATGTAKASSPPPSRPSPSRASHPSPLESAYPPRPPQQPQQQHAPPSSSYPPGYPAAQPPQPPPLQRPQASPERSSSYGSVQSPYQYPSAIAQSLRGQSPPPPPPPYAASTPRDRDSYSSSVSYSHPQQQPQRHQSAGALASPYTPQPASAGAQHPEQQQQQSYIAQQRSQSIQESPPPGASQSHPSQQFSPPAQGSIPSTPRGSTTASYPHHTPPSARPQSSGHDSRSHRASSPWIGQDSHPHMSPTALSRDSRQDSRQLEQMPRQYPPEVERRASDESVSPKTSFPPGSRQGSMVSNSDKTGPSQLNHVVNSTSKENLAVLNSSQPAVSAQNSHPPPVAPHLNSSPARAFVANESPARDQSHLLHSKMDVAPDLTTNSSPHPPKRKRRRYNEPPIFAQRAVRVKGRCPMIPNLHPPIPKHARNSPRNPFLMRKRSSSAHAPAATSVVATSVVTPVKVKSETPPVNGPPVPREPPQTGSLGPWEPSITGFIPHEEITKLICDFLFQHVVLRNDATAAATGSVATGQGAIIEVEAKLGQIMDMDRGERLQLPILTESVISKENSRFRTAFESSMTVAQHRAMNNFLNEAVKASMPHTNQGRIPLSYAHKKERDTFYEVSPSELPPIIRQNLNPRHKPKVRVTVDQRTGEVLAKIVKCRIADLDVHSPRTCVDWRVSVNLEISYDGDVSHLPVAESTGRGGDRNKDRMSYRHLAYQVDLTQVAKSEPPSKGDFEHELEIEMSAAEIRRQGQLAMAGDPTNQYEELVKGFVDNIRVLARAVPP